MKVQRESDMITYFDLSKGDLVRFLTLRMGFKKGENAYRDAYFLKHGIKTIIFLIDDVPECQAAYDMTIMAFEEDLSGDECTESRCILSMDFKIKEWSDRYVFSYTLHLNGDFEFDIHCIEKEEIGQDSKVFQSLINRTEYSSRIMPHEFMEILEQMGFHKIGETKYELERNFYFSDFVVNRIEIDIRAESDSYEDYMVYITYKKAGCNADWVDGYRLRDITIRRDEDGGYVVFTDENPNLIII